MIKIDNKVIFHGKFLGKKTNFVKDLIKGNGKFKSWEEITRELKIDKNLYFKRIQLLQYHAVPILYSTRLQ